MTVNGSRIDKPGQLRYNDSRYRFSKVPSVVQEPPRRIAT